MPIFDFDILAHGLGMFTKPAIIFAVQLFFPFIKALKVVFINFEMGNRINVGRVYTFACYN